MSTTKLDRDWQIDPPPPQGSPQANIYMDKKSGATMYHHRPPRTGAEWARGIRTRIHAGLFDHLTEENNK